MSSSPSPTVKLTYGDINAQNINMLRKLNFQVFPVKYSTSFYVKVSKQYTKLSKFAFYNDIIIGAYTVRVEMYKERKHAYILTFGVLEPYRKWGIGSQMMAMLEKDVRENTDVQAIYLHMHVVNQVGRKFYEKCGFTVTERLDNYYTDLEEPHCFVLTREIVRDKGKETKQAEKEEKKQEKK